MKRPSWNDLNAVKTIAEQHSFRRAADVLGVKRSSLSHLVKSMEANLGVRLFHRTTRSVSLTQAGERMLARLTPLLEEMDEVLNEVKGRSQQPYGTLRISASDAAIRLLLEKVLPRFSEQTPGIEVDVAAQGALVDIIALGFDAGIRLWEDVPKDMVAIALTGPLRFVTVGSPAYLADNPPLLHPDDLHHHRCIRQRLPSGKRYHWEYAFNGESRAIDVPGNLTLDNSQLMVEAAAAGLGLAYVPELYAQPLLAQRQLETRLEAWSPSSAGIALYFPPNRHMPLPLRLFVDTLKAALPVSL